MNMINMILSSFGVIKGLFSTVFSGFSTYLTIGTFVLGIGAGFYGGSIWYNYKYQSEIAQNNKEISELQLNYLNYKNDTLLNAQKQNDRLNVLQNNNNNLSEQVKQEHDNYVTTQQKLSNVLRKGLQDAKDGTVLSASAVNYFNQLRNNTTGN